MLQVLCNLFQLQLAVMLSDKQDVSNLSSSIMQLLEQLEAQEQKPSSSSLAYLKLHLLMLQLMMLLQSGSFKDIEGEAKEQPKGQQDPSPQSLSMVEQMDDLLQQLPDSTQQAATAAQQQQQYDWLPPPVLTAVVQLLAALVDKNGGRQKPGQARIAKGEIACSSRVLVMSSAASIRGAGLHDVPG